MSRFWAAGDSSDSDSSDDDSYSSSDDSGNVGNRNENRWIDFSDDSDSEDEVRVVKSAKERSMETFEMHMKNIRNAMKVRDFIKIQQEFDDLSKAMVKAKKVLQQGVPKQLVRILVDLEDFVQERLADKPAFKKLSPGQGRALNRMKLTLRKHNKAYQAVIDAYRKNPIVDDDEADDDDDDDDDDSDSDSDSDSDDDDDSDDSDDVKAKTAAAKRKKAVDSDDSDDSDDDSDSSDDSDSDSDDSDDSDDDGDGDDADWGSDSDDDDSDDDDDQGAYSQLKGRARWLKKNTVVKQKVGKDKEARARLRAEQKAAAAVAADAAEANKASKSILPEEDLTPSLLNKKVKELVASRGRRGTDTRQILRQLEALAKLSLQFGPRVEIPILMNVITAQFDLQRNMDDFMATKMWKSCASYLTRVASVLEDGYKLGAAAVEESDMLLASVGVAGKKMKAAANASGGAMAAVAADEKLVNPHTGEPETEDERAERLRLEKEENMTEEEKKTIPVMGSMVLFLTRLEEEYIKSLQHLSPHSQEYMVRLRDESKLVELLTKGQAYFERQDSPTEAAVLAQLRVEHIYYRHDSIAEQVDKAAVFYKKYGEIDALHPACVSSSKGDADVAKTHPAASSGKPAVEELSNACPSTELLKELCTFVYQHGNDRSKTRAMICHIFHHALHDRFVEARDLLLMSHLQDTISNAGDVSTMILFNRMMVTVGMAAFRLGKIWSAHQCLAEICSGRVRELLAQGVAGRFTNDKNAEQEKAEKRRQVPYHQHIHMDLLEACHLISAMLLEVPNMAAAEERRPRIISRYFRKHHDIYERQVFTGPPEVIRDFVMRASKALRKGDWKTCADYLTGMDVWKLVPGEGAGEKIKSMLVEKIKLEGLRTYLLAFSSQYDSLSLAQLCGMFEMTKTEVHSVVSKMMINRDLYASWDQPTETIVLRKVEPTSLQIMAFQFAEKAASLVEANERLLDATSGSYGYKDDNWKHNDGGNYYHQNRASHGTRYRSGGGKQRIGGGGRSRTNRGRNN